MSSSLGKPLIVSTLFALLVASPMVAAPPVAPSPDLAASEVRQVYDRLATLITRAGHQVSFEITGLETYPAAEFDEIYYADTVSMPNGWVLQATRSTHRYSKTSKAGETQRWQTLAYPAQWQRQHGVPATPRERDLWLSERVSVMLDLIRQEGDDPEVGDAEALTRYRVKARLDGREVEYKAAFFWLREPDPESGEPRWRGIPVDMITRGVREVSREQQPGED